MKLGKLLNSSFRFVFISSLLILASCSKSSPSGFWKNFNKKQIVENLSNQGPFGGKREIEWKNIDNKIKVEDFLKYAKTNDWILIDSISLEDKKLKKTRLKKVDNYALEILEEQIIPKLNSHQTKIYIFSSGWINIKPGTEIETEQNGFLVTEIGNSNFKIFHYWGE